MANGKGNDGAAKNNQENGSCNMKNIKELPSNTDAEKVLLGSILVKGASFEVVSRSLSATDFSLERHVRIFSRMADIHKRGEEINRITVANELKSQGQLEHDGLAYLLSLDEGMPELASVDSYIRIVKEKATLRRLAFHGQKILDRAIGNADQAGQIIEESINEIKQIELGLPGGDEVPSLESIVDRITPSEIIKPSARHSLKTGITKYDFMTTGLEPGTLTVIGGRPSAGKTMVGLNMARNIAGSGVPIGFFSLEMTQRGLIDRMMCSDARVNLMKFRLGSVDKAEEKRLTQALAGIYALPMYIDETTIQTLSDISRKTDKLKRDKGVKVIFLDYLQQMLLGNRNGRDREDQILTNIIEGLKGIAKHMNIAVCVMSQLNRGPENKKDHRPTSGELRGSGGIEQAADVIGLLYRQIQYEPDRTDLKEYLEINISKNRQGETGVFGVKFLGEYGRIEDV